jgi:hypothetical protein
MLIVRQYVMAYHYGLFVWVGRGGIKISLPGQVVHDIEAKRSISAHFQKIPSTTRLSPYYSVSLSPQAGYHHESQSNNHHMSNILPEMNKISSSLTNPTPQGLAQKLPALADEIVRPFSHNFD